MAATLMRVRCRIWWLPLCCVAFSCKSDLERCRQLCLETMRVCEYKAGQALGRCDYKAPKTSACQAVNTCRASARRCKSGCKQADERGQIRIPETESSTLVLKGRVVNALTREPVAGLKLRAVNAGKRDPSPMTTTTNAQGEYSFEGLARGTYYGVQPVDTSAYEEMGFTGADTPRRGALTGSREIVLCPKKLKPGIFVFADGKLSRPLEPIAFSKFDLPEASNKVGQINPYTSLHFYYLSANRFDAINGKIPKLRHGKDRILIVGPYAKRRVRFNALKPFPARTIAGIMGRWTAQLPRGWYAGVARIQLTYGRFHRNSAEYKTLSAKKAACGLTQIDTFLASNRLSKVWLPGYYVISAQPMFGNLTRSVTISKRPLTGFVFQVVQ